GMVFLVVGAFWVQAAATKPTLVIASGAGESTGDARAAVFEVSFDFLNAVQVAYPLNLVVFQGTHFVRYPASGPAVTGDSAALAAALLGMAFSTPVAGTSFPIFAGDPIDSGTGRPYTILPGLPLLLPQPTGQFSPPIVDASKHGDIDLVVRAGHVMGGPSIPPPVATPPTAVAGGVQLVAGSEIPFTVIASDGDPATPYGHPLPGPEMDGIPVLVGAFADLDGDGVIGPTNADPTGDVDNARELQESNFLVGRQIAIFQNGVASG